MNIWERLDRDHVIIHASGTGILQSHGDLPRRHNQFANFEHEVRRHLDVVEEVIFPWLKKDMATRSLVHDLRREHRQLRRQLSRLDRRDKTADWMEEFNLFLVDFEASCRQHDGLENVSREIIDETAAQQLGEEYEQARMKRLAHPKRRWSKMGVGVGLGAAIGAAAIGAVLVGMRRGREEAAWDEDEPPVDRDERLELGRIEGMPLLTRAGERIGRIEGAVIDLDGGQVAYALLSLPDWPDSERGLIPVPWRLLDHDDRWDGYVFSHAPEELYRAPRILRSAHPVFDMGFRHQIADFYERSGEDEEFGGAPSALASDITEPA